MTFEAALKVEIGDVLISSFTTTQMREGDQVILVERSRDYNGLENDTGGWFYNRRLKSCHGANIQDFNLVKIQ